MRILSTVEFTE